MGWFGRRRNTDEPTLEQLRGWHLLLLPDGTDGTDVGQVDALVRCRYPDARLAEGGRVRLGRGSALSGPHVLEPDELEYVKVPAPWRVAYALEVTPEPDAAAFDDIGDPVLRAWWMRAFPRGKPYREEGDAVDLALSLARRLGGVLRAAGSNVILEPDHGKAVDLTVWSGYWLDPDRLLALLEPVLAGAVVDLGVPGRHEAPPGSASSSPASSSSGSSAPWSEAPPGSASSSPASSSSGSSAPWSADPLDPRAVDLEHALGEEDHEIIHAVSSETDAKALAADVVLDGYALTADGNVLVEVIQEDAVPGWVRGRVGHQLIAEGNPVVTYSVRWMADDPLALESEDPPYAFRIERERIRPRLRTAALALAEATAGVVSDALGFEVDRYTL